MEDNLIASKSLDYPEPSTLYLSSFGQIVWNSSPSQKTGNPQLITPEHSVRIVPTIDTIGRARRVEMVLLLRNIYY